MEICFVPDNDYAGFIEREAESVPGSGNFVDKNGVILGKHDHQIPTAQKT